MTLPNARRGSPGLVPDPLEEGGENAVVEPTPQGPSDFATTGQALMALKQAVRLASSESWLSVARFKPASDAPDATFSVYAIWEGEATWVADYAPTDLSLQDIPDVVQEILESRASLQGQ